MRHATGLACALLAGVLLVAPTEGGEEAKRPARQRPFKKIHFPGMKLLAAGKPEEAAAAFQRLLESNPEDLESLYGLAAAAAELGRTQEAMARVRKAVELGLPFGRFLAGPRHWFEPLARDAAFQAFAKEQGVALVHGPMVGCVTDTSARFWVRTASEASVQVALSHSQRLEQPVTTAPVRTRKEDDYTAVAEAKGLKPDAAYYCEVLVDGKPALGPQYPIFRTFPPLGTKARFEVAFGGGAGYTPWNERMWDTVLKHRPLAFLFLGDNVYIDTPTSPDMQRYCYYRRQSRPEFRRLCAATAVYAIWDDHDFGANDCIPGPDVDRPAWKLPVWRLFRENWNNPAYGGGTEAQPGCWLDFSIGDVDFFMTDGRYYREHPRKVETPSMLGPVQKRWLLERLQASKATFKVLCSGTPWAYGTKPGSLDTWEGFKAEREEILDCVERARIGGVVLLSADRHRADVWKLERTVGYPLYEFETSRLTNVHRHGAIRNPKCLFSYNAKQSFGLLTFDTTKPDPVVTYRIFTIDDEEVHSITLKRSQLTPR